MDAVQILATLAVLSTLIKGAVDATRRRYPKLDGGLVQLLAISLSTGLAAGLDLRGTEAVLSLLGGYAGRHPVALLDYLLTGIVIAFGAGTLAELVGRSGGNNAVIEIDQDGKPVL